MNATYKNGKQSQPLMVWTNLWPNGVPAQPKGWTEQLNPGVSVLLDEAGEEAQQWLAALTGHAIPGSGSVQCSGLDSQADSAVYQAHVFWHNPRMEMQAREITGLEWLQTVAQRWPAWSEDAWQAHSQGFELEQHLHKPLWHLSTGSLRKLNIAAALASGARLTVIEEPIAGLDQASIRYLSQALDSLGEDLASAPDAPRWVIVAHWEPLAGVTWDEVLAPPCLVSA